MNNNFNREKFVECLADLCGEKCPHKQHEPHLDRLFESIQEIGYSQFNELLLLLGFDSICAEFFDFLCTGANAQRPDGEGPKIQNIKDFGKMVDRSQRLSLLAFGNVKFGFKKFSRNPELLDEFIGLFGPITAGRHNSRIPPAIPVVDIPAEDRYYMGYLIQREIAERLSVNPDDADCLAQHEKAGNVVKLGKLNQHAYLTSDYLDVYVATSMRQQHEFVAVAQFTKELFSSPDLKALNLRYFDPTLAFCDDRIDKGLSEALMLKQSRCTIFLAQESDTLGKDSELASTLAQGKAVIAYVPRGDAEYVNALLEMLESVYPTMSTVDLILEQLMLIAPQLAWKNAQVKGWIAACADIDEKELLTFFHDAVQKHYDKRADLLRNSHPLGIQVNLQTGVAIGVLVVRDISTCAQLLKRVMLGECVFEIEKKLKNDAKHLILKEEISGSIYRVMTYDPLLTHAFWNSYLK